MSGLNADRIPRTPAQEPYARIAAVVCVLVVIACTVAACLQAAA